MGNEAESVRRVCLALKNGGRDAALDLLRDQLPFPALQPFRRAVKPDDALRVFIRDGFIDRYTGERLLFPGVLRLLSFLFPVEVPYHPNWKAGKTHPLYWSLQPTIDHVVPLGRGGVDELKNCVTTSIVRNALKGQWTLDELGWKLRAPGRIEEWDGLMGWFCEYIRQTRAGLVVIQIKRWYLAALRASVSG